MKQPAFALFERALRLESRSPLISWSRGGLLVIMLLLLVPIQTMTRFGVYSAPGLQFFTQMIWVNLLFITLAGMSYFASAITEEKEEYMLGLLRMTDLNSIAILLGKSTSRLVGALLLLVVQVPFILLAVTLGGVSPIQIAAAYGTLLAYLFLLSNLALLFSVVCRNTAGSAGVTLLFVILFFFGASLISAIIRGIESAYGINPERGLWSLFTAAVEFLRSASPANRLGTIFRTGFTGPVIGFQIVSNLAMGVVFFLLAWALFDLCTREEKDAGPARRFFWHRTSRRSSRIPRRLIGPAVITWKDYTFTAGGRWGLFARFAVVLTLIVVCNVIYFFEEGKISREVLGSTLIWVSLIATMVWLAFEASRIFKEEVRWKTLSSLMTLPVSVRELAYRKVAGALKGTLPLLACFVAGTIVVPEQVVDFFDALFESGMAFGMFLLTVLQYLLFLHLTAFLSLVVKRGALPLAIAIQYIGGSMVMGFVSALLIVTVGEAIPVFIAIVSAVLTVILHYAIGMRLQRIAAEE